MFLYKRVYEDLKTKILSGVYPKDSLLPSEREIGEIYQVDRTTVRKALQVLASENWVEKKAGKGTIVTMKESQPNVAAPVESTGVKPSLAFFLPKGQDNNSRITQPFYAALFYNTEKECQRRGYSLVYSTLDENDDFDSLIAQNAFSGIFFVSNVATSHITKAVQRQLPAVLINSYDEKIPSILSDNFNGTYQACSHLIDQGHTSIAVLNGDASYTSNMERLRGCCSALKEHNLSLKSEWNLGGTSWEFEAGFAAVAQMLKNASELPTALVAFNDRLAAGAIQAIHQAGLTVPNNISVTGYDNSEQSRYSVPKITTVEAHVELMAKISARMLFQLIDDYEACPIRILTPAELIVRESVKPICD